VTCLGVDIDADLTSNAREAGPSGCFHQLRHLWSRLRNDLYCVGWGVKLCSTNHLWSIRPALCADNARMLDHAVSASRLDYCNSILYQAAAVSSSSFQLARNAAVRLVVKKRKLDNITPTLCDDLHWLLVQDMSTGLQMPASARCILPRVDDHSSVGNFNVTDVIYSLLI